MMPADYIARMEQLFADNANAAYAVQMQRYMKDISPFYGIKSPDRKALGRQFIKAHGYPDAGDFQSFITAAWAAGCRELQYFGMETAWAMRKKLCAADLDVVRFMITRKSWWDTVDFIASNIAGYFFMHYPELRHPSVEDWMASGNLWLQRTCLLYQLKYKDATDGDVLFDLCLRLKGHPDFFIRKAIGWALRQYARTDPDAVRAFVSGTSLSPLSYREAMKHL